MILRIASLRETWNAEVVLYTDIASYAYLQRRVRLNCQKWDLYAKAELSYSSSNIF